MSRGWRKVAIVAGLAAGLAGCGSEDGDVSDGGVPNDTTTTPDRSSNDARGSDQSTDPRSDANTDTGTDSGDSGDSGADRSNDVGADGRIDASADTGTADMSATDTELDATSDASDAGGSDADLDGALADAADADTTAGDATIADTRDGDFTDADANDGGADSATDMDANGDAPLGDVDSGDGAAGDADGGAGDLVVWLPFTGNADDATSYGNDGTVEGGASLTAGRLGTADTAYSFDMVDDRIVIADSSSTNLASFQNGYTIAAWVRATDATAGVHMVVAKGDGAFSLNLAGLELRACHRNGGGSSVCQTSANCAATLDQWSHIAVTWDAVTEKWQLYNGGAPCSFTNGSQTGLSQIAAAPLIVGSDSPTGQSYFKGAIDSVRIYRRALSALEIAALFALD